MSVDFLLKQTSCPLPSTNPRGGGGSSSLKSRGGGCWVLEREEEEKEGKGRGGKGWFYTLPFTPQRSLGMAYEHPPFLSFNGHPVR